jgi:hypothetical protein
MTLCPIVADLVTVAARTGVAVSTIMANTVASEARALRMASSCGVQTNGRENITMLS